jgi:protein SCO1/2
LVTARLAAVLLAALFCVAGCGKPEAPRFQSTDITGADFARTLDLTGHDGKKRTLADFSGGVLVVFFGFTHCPDVCPTTLARFAAVLKSLGPDAGRVQVVLVTVDPARDTPEILAKYVTAFDPSFLGLTGDAAAIERTAKEFRVVYEKQAGQSPETYTVDHSSGAYVFDPKGRVRLFVSGQQDAAALDHDIRLLLAGA